MTETHTLLPCPFCGGDAQFHTDNGPTGECYGWVGCNQCDAMSLHCDVRSMQPEDIHPIDAWNTRTENTSATEPVAWQDINIAPHDWTWILCWGPDAGHGVFRLSPNPEWAEEPEYTHWQPLPTPPEAS